MTVIKRSADVVVPVYGDAPVTRACLESVLAHSGSSLARLIVVNDCSPDPGMDLLLRDVAEEHPRVIILRNEQNQGFVASANRGLFVRERDVVLLNSDTIATDGWLEEMLDVAYSHDRIAAVAPLSNNATINSVPEFLSGSPPTSLHEYQDLVRASALPRMTESPTAVGFCMLLKHFVLNMIGGLDPTFGRGYNEENDWVMRAQRLGFITVRANRAFVYHLGSVSFGKERNELERRNATLLAERHPHYAASVAAFCDGPEARIAAHYVRRRLGKVAISLDLRYLPANTVHGTGVYALELARHLRARTAFQISAYVATTSQKRLMRDLDIPTLRADTPNPIAQVLHRPAQIFDPRELELYLNSPSHTVITYQDLIAFRVPVTMARFEHYSRYRAMSYAQLHAAQAIIAISDHCRREIIREFQVNPDRVHTIYHGVNSEFFNARDDARNAELLGRQQLRCPFFLYVGSDYPHKNVKLLIASYERFRSLWKGNGEPPALVLAGPVSQSGVGLYERIREHWPRGVRYLGAVSSDTLRALYQEAIAFVFLSSYEGFGLPILEAMAAGTPVLSSSLTSLPEVAGDAALYVRDFSDEEIAHLMQSLATDADLRQRLIDAGLHRASEFTWSETARRTANVYEEVIDRPAPDTLLQRRMLSTLITGALR